MNRIVVLGGSGFVGRALCRRLVARWPALRLVVTSDWRHRLTLDQLCAPLSPLARARVQGTTLP